MGEAISRVTCFCNFCKLSIRFSLEKEIGILDNMHVVTFCHLSTEYLFPFRGIWIDYFNLAINSGSNKIQIQEEP